VEHEPQIPTEAASTTGADASTTVPNAATAAAQEAAPAPGPELVPAAPVVAGPAVGAPAARRGGGARLINVALGVALVLALGGVAFAAGRLTAPTSVTAGNLPGGGIQIGPGKDGQGFVQNGKPGGAFTGGPTLEGTVESITDTTLTLKTADGQTIQIALESSTTYHAQTDATADDVTTGGKVQVRLNVRAGNGSGNATNPAASDVTVVP
jgi:hypothetical protein